MERTDHDKATLSRHNPQHTAQLRAGSQTLFHATTHPGYNVSDSIPLAYILCSIEVKRR